MTERWITTGYTGSLDKNREWSATESGYEPGDAIGYGPTEQDAINELIWIKQEDARRLV
ncbi:hypothetical protein UFOVP56_37 [uncultured Caudovirales phage]|uniref:Uncharacterized protein n=1 Tax=uncultured Caudovirales phage TaxID=2100421 RepID=A0A6J5T8D7_9CAUD|nr:hypothetical protein UFOVP56_37 [uncultured Caudovirales phage]